MRSNWLYLAIRSERLREPVLIDRNSSPLRNRRSSHLGFTRAMAHHGGVSVAMGEFDRVKCSSQRADLVDFNEN